jgi:transposase InsO family protein
MREHGIVAVQMLLLRKMTDSIHTLGFVPNLLQRNFAARSVDRVWIGDVSYLWAAEGWCCRAVLLDLFSRRVAGCAFV